MIHQNPTLIFSAEAWRKALTYVQLHEMEINGWAYVEKLSPRTFYVRDAADVFITDQLVTAGSADVDGATFAHALVRAGKENRSESLRLQWHSHVRGDVYYSSVDLGTIEDYALGGVAYMISVVLNMYGHVEARIDAYTPVRTSMPMAVLVEQEQADQAMIEECAEDMLKHVQARKFVELEVKEMIAVGESFEKEPREAFTSPEPLGAEDLRYEDVRIRPLKPLGGHSAS